MTDKTTAGNAVIAAALAMADSLEWNVTDHGHGAVGCGYEEASALAGAVAEYKRAFDMPISNGQKRSDAMRGLANLMRRSRP
jgi:hypothetical protein